jgi:hypothetical protein
MRRFRSLVRTVEIIQSIIPGKNPIFSAIVGDIEQSSSQSDDILDLLGSFMATGRSSSNIDTRFPSESGAKQSTIWDNKSSPCLSQVRIQRAARLSVISMKKYLHGCDNSSSRRLSWVASTPIFIKLISHFPQSSLSFMNYL